MSRGLGYVYKRQAAKHPKWKEKLEKAREQTEILQQETRDLFLYDRKRLAEIFLCSLAKMTCWYLIPCVMLCGQNGISFDTVLPLTAVSYMLSGVIPVPGGFGSVEGIFYLLFSPLTGQGAVLSAILIFRFAVTFFPALIGAFVFFTE